MIDQLNKLHTKIQTEREDEKNNQFIKEMFHDENKNKIKNKINSIKENENSSSEDENEKNKKNTKNNYFVKQPAVELVKSSQTNKNQKSKSPMRGNNNNNYDELNNTTTINNNDVIINISNLNISGTTPTSNVFHTIGINNHSLRTGQSLDDILFSDKNHIRNVNQLDKNKISSKFTLVKILDNLKQFVIAKKYYLLAFLIILIILVRLLI